jgi:type IX secretion system PorP/SprF family membrane protein
MKRIIFLLLLSFIASQAILAQEFHMTQYNSPSLVINPAFTGVMNRDLRVAALYRSQYGSVKGPGVSPYTNYLFSADAAIFPKGSGSDFWGVGLLAYRHGQGFFDLNTTAAALSASYSKALDAAGYSFLTFSFMGGYSQLARGADLSNLTWDNQWDFQKATFNGSVSPNEDNFLANGRKNFNYADMSAGALYNSLINKNIQMNAGIALWHINAPNISLSKTGDAKLNRKLVVHSQWDITTAYDAKIRLVPSFCYVRQGSQQIINIGIGSRFMLKQQSMYTEYKKESSLYFGLNYRHKDAISPIVRFDYNSFSFGMSYDINISKLRLVSNGNGAMEFYLIFNSKQEFGAKAKTRKIHFL